MYVFLPLIKEMETLGNGSIGIRNCIFVRISVHMLSIKRLNDIIIKTKNIHKKENKL